jgi:bifunctional non-homologous end joining protein LigD
MNLPATRTSFDDSRCRCRIPSHSNPCFARAPSACPRAGSGTYELKLEGFRAIGRKSERGGQLWSRNQKDFARRFPQVVKAIAQLPNDTIIDGEIVALDEHGKPSFNLLQGLGKADEIVLYAFDLLMLGGRDVRGWPLGGRWVAAVMHSANSSTPCR